MPRFPLVLLALALAGCDAATADRPDVVVSALLGAGEPLPAVVLSRAAPLLDVYDPAALAVEGASVTVALVGPDGGDEAVYAYRPGTPGEYVPAGPAPAVQEGRTYRLAVDVPGGGRIAARTTVPARFETVDPPPAAVAYGDGQGPSVRVTTTSTAGRQAAFVGSTRALAPDAWDRVAVDGAERFRSQNLPGRFRPTAFRQRTLGCAPDGAALVCESDPGLEDVLVGTSPVLGEAAYLDLGDGTVVVRVPFVAFGYYGPQSLTLVSVDDALRAFVQTQAVQGGGTTLSPGEVPNVTTNVEGGLGVFGSFARARLTTSITAP